MCQWQTEFFIFKEAWTGLNLVNSTDKSHSMKHCIFTRESILECITEITITVYVCMYDWTHTEEIHYFVLILQVLSTIDPVHMYN